MKENVSKEEAEEVKKALEAAGGTVEIDFWSVVQLAWFVIKIHFSVELTLPIALSLSQLLCWCWSQNKRLLKV
mgnify:CR=1 FL=1